MISILPDACSLIAQYESVSLSLNDQMQLAKEDLRGFQQAILFCIPLLEQLHALSPQLMRRKIVSCKLWTDQTTCSRGPGCHFSHNLATLWANNLVWIAKNFPRAPQFKTLPCFFKNHCTRKKECRFLHASGELCLLPLFDLGRKFYGFRVSLFIEGNFDQEINRHFYKCLLRHEVSPLPSRESTPETSDNPPSPIVQLFTQKCLIPPLALSHSE